MRATMYGLDDIKNTKGMHIAYLYKRSVTDKLYVIKAQFVISNLHAYVVGLSKMWLYYKQQEHCYIMELMNYALFHMVHNNIS